MKQYNIEQAKKYLEGLEERDVMEESMKNVLDYLESHRMKGQVMPEYGMINLRFGGDKYPLVMKIEFDANRETASASVAMPAFCVEEKRTVLAELLHRINFVTVLGEWKFDNRDGECMIKYTHFVGDTPLSLKQAERMVDISLLSAHMYEGTIIPLLMGKEPESDNACSEYKAMMGMDDDHSLLRRMLQQALEAKQKEALEKNSGENNSAETEE